MAQKNITPLLEVACKKANELKDELSVSPISITLESGETAEFKLEGLAMNDIMGSTELPEEFPQNWICENGVFEVTLADMQSIIPAYYARRKELVFQAATLKNQTFPNMSRIELNNWLKSPSLS